MKDELAAHLLATSIVADNIVSYVMALPDCSMCAFVGTFIVQLDSGRFVDMTEDFKNKRKVLQVVDEGGVGIGAELLHVLEAHD